MRRVLLFLTLVAGLSAQVIYPPPTNQIAIVYGNNQEALPNSPFLRPMTVQVISPAGYPVPGVPITFALPALGKGVAGANFTGNSANPSITSTVTTNAAGFAVSPGMTADSPLGSFVATVSSAGVPSIQFKLKTVYLPNPGVPVALPNWLAYNMVIGGTAPAAQTVTVLTDPINFYTVAADAPWIKLAPRTSRTLDVSVDPTGMPFGHYEGLVMLSRDTPVRVRLDIFDRPTINSSQTSLNFTYSQGSTTVPIQQQFTVGSAVRLIDVAVDPIYTNPKTGNWLGIASRRGVTLPITLTAVVDPRGLEPGTYQGAIQITSADARNSPFLVAVTLTVTPYRAPNQPRIPIITSFVSAASVLNEAISNGQLVRLGGLDLSCQSTPRVDIDGRNATVISAGDREINLVVPEIYYNQDRVAVRVMCGNISSDPFSVPVAFASPALFSMRDSQALGYNEDFTMNAEETPAVRGSVITLFGTGFGSLDEADPNGNFLAPVSVNIGGEPAQLLSASAVKDMPGVVQLRVRVPAWSATGAVPFEVQSGFEKSSAIRTIAVK